MRHIIHIGWNCLLRLVVLVDVVGCREWFLVGIEIALIRCGYIAHSLDDIYIL